MNFKKLETAQKLRGGYYTEPDIASFLSAWVLEKQPTRVLEPSCGDGAFVEAISRLEHGSVESIDLCEIDPDEACVAKEKARMLGDVKVMVRVGDFLEWSLPRLEGLPKFDAVVGNPPFIRYQYLDPEVQYRSEQIFERFRLPFTKHTNAWVPFIISSLAQLLPGGRLAMVVPAEILHVIHAKSLRDFLLAQCSQVLILDPQHIWFNETLQGVVLLLAEKKKTLSSVPAMISVTPVKNRAELQGKASTYFGKCDYISGTKMNGKWMLALLSAAERSIVEELSKKPFIRPFDRVADVDVGIVTGANNFFLVPDSVIEQYDLRSFAHPMFGRSDHVQGVIYDERNHARNKAEGLPTNFLWFRDELIEQLPPKVREYIRLGESQDLHKRYKCRIRSPWYSVPSVYAASVGMLKRSHHFPRLLLNKVGAYTTDTAYRVRSKEMKDADLVVAFLNSLTALTAELEGRHYGGGVLELVPSEIEKLLIPVSQFSPSAIEELDRSFRSQMPPEELFAQQDALVLRPLGITKKNCLALLDAWIKLRDRRQRSEPAAD
ncbi:MAG: N-6 DNA methylase [Thermoguttaceae bacterium]|jgi:adenine-specific DNA methylase